MSLAVHASPVHLPLGPVVVDIAGTELTERERLRLLHPMVGGVILFARNFASLSQLISLTSQIRALRKPGLLISVDHEGGRVQRFRRGFTRLPAMSVFGDIWTESPVRACRLAEKTGYVLAAELFASGVDFSFAPVLDLDYGKSAVIGNRAFHASPAVVAKLAASLMAGMRLAGMHACGKHFPGHGFVEVDSHHGLPVDSRTLSEISAADLLPYKQLLDAGLTAVMPAHVIYSSVDTKPAGFSEKWLKQILRKEIGFQGVIISDALDMEGASFAGASLGERVLAALSAGCDLVLATNKPDETDEMLKTLRYAVSPVSLARLARLHAEPHKKLTWETLSADLDFQAIRQEVAALTDGIDDTVWGLNVGEAD